MGLKTEPPDPKFGEIVATSALDRSEFDVGFRKPRRRCSLTSSEPFVTRSTMSRKKAETCTARMINHGCLAESYWNQLTTDFEER